MRKFLIVSLVAFFLLNACDSRKSPVNFEGGNPGNHPALDGYYSENDETSVKNISEPVKSETANTGETNTGETEKISPKIIKTASITCKTEKYDTDKQNIYTAVKKYKAYISNESESKYEVMVNSNFTIRVPAENFDSLVNTLLTGTGEIENKLIKATDVTEEYIDVATRLKSKKEVQSQYFVLLKKANTIGDILDVNDHLRIITEEIESKEGRLKYLDNQVAFSTIDLNLYQKYKKDYGFFGKILEALEGGWQGLLAFLIGLVYVWPLLLFSILVIFIIRRILKKRREKRQNK